MHAPSSLSTLLLLSLAAVSMFLADSFARAGYVTVMPDLFGGVPAPGDINVPGFNTTELLDRRSPDVTDPIVANTIEYIHTKLGVVFAAHPGLLQSSEILAVEGPVAVAAGDHDNLFTAELRNELEALLLMVAQPYQVSLYSGTGHGFAVRMDLNDPQQKFAKQESFLQAVRWFGHFL
ncbi:hypothetical protein BT67DRAFT_449093 [Trichocladium antarcticum]|uniref:Dienelactone hydrolase domain-containing protein n=1 Tax=Trichocladium antarcticum TaxID=1450529 RepID=A0AAN6UM25_9PEZI|nr:hypothetical protein BT67DRAFT_449093 [Trichocladium antarcticum]